MISLMKTKCLFPVAGYGTRFLPATKAMPKEMLPVVDKPLIEYAVDEAKAAGIEEFIFVTGRGKAAIEDHFDLSLELESQMLDRGKNQEALISHSALKLKGIKNKNTNNIKRFLIELIISQKRLKKSTLIIIKTISCPKVH